MNQTEQAERGRQLLGQAYKQLGIFHFGTTSAEERDGALATALVTTQQALQVMREMLAARRFEHRRDVE